MKRTIIIIVLVLSLGSQLVWSQELNESQNELIFETLHDNPYDRSVVTEANYVVELHLPLRSSLYVPESLEQWCGYQEFSEDQQRLIKLYPGYIAPNHYSTQSYSVYHILAVSEEDVPLLVSSVLKSDVQLINQELEGFKAETISWEEGLKENEFLLPQLEQDLDKWQKTIPEAIAAYKANVSCVFEDSDEPSALSHATKNADDVSVHIREVEFELIGLDAKLNAIETIFKEKQGTMSRRVSLTCNNEPELDRLLATLEIERAGALARKAAYEKTFEQAKAVIEVIHTRDQFEEKVSLCQASIGNARYHVDRFSSRIEGLSRVIQNTRPLKILDNKVFIYPVVH